jgi:hypothetical protein
MAPSNLSPSRLRRNNDLERVKQLLGWLAVEFDGRMCCGTLPLDGLQPSEFYFFTSYAPVGLALPVSSFLFTLLDNYGL